MGIKEPQCFGLAKPHLARIWESLTAGYATHVADPLRLYYDIGARSGAANCLMFSEIVSNFDGVPGTRIVTDNKNHLRFLCFEDVLLLWLKKVSPDRFTTNYQTVLAKERLDGQMTLDGLPDATIITLGYLPNAEESAISRISFSPPFRFKPAWYFDLVPVGNVTQMGKREPQEKGARFIVVRGNSQDAMGL